MTITSPAKVTFKKIEKLSLRTESDVWRRVFVVVAVGGTRGLENSAQKRGKQRE